MKLYLRTFRYFFWKGLLDNQGIKHNHILQSTKVKRVKKVYIEEFNVSEDFFQKNQDILFELMLPSRTENESENADFIQKMRDSFGQKPNLKNVGILLRDPVIA